MVGHKPYNVKQKIVCKIQVLSEENAITFCCDR